MGFLYKSGRVRSFILIFLTFIALVISIPVGKHFTSSINNGISDLLDNIQKDTGLKISYKSLSPSILSNVFIHDIEISKNEEKILTINQTKIGINIFKLIKGDVQNGITYILIDGVKIELSELIDIFNSLSKNTSNDDKQLSSNISKYIPQNIKLKNIDVLYKNKGLNAAVNLKKINVDNNLKKNLISVQFDSSIEANVSNAPVDVLNQNISCKMAVNGNITRQMDEAHFTVKLSDLTNGTYKIGKLNLQAGYENNQFEIHTIQVVNPVSVGVKYDLENKDLNVQFNADNLAPFNIISANSKQKKLQKLKNTVFNTDTIVKCNLSEKSVNFISDTDCILPDEIFEGGLKAGFSVFGNQDKLEIKKLYLEGENCSAQSELSFNYKNLQLTGLFELPYFKLKNGKTISTEVYFEALEKGFMAFSPQLFIEEQSLTALQLSVLPGTDSFDFNLEASDYSHVYESEPGKIQIDGSYLLKSNYIQSSILLNTIYLDSVVGFVCEFLDSETSRKLSSIKEGTSAYALSGDMYFSTDFKDLSYNIPYILLANTKKDNQVVMLSVNGNEQNFQINNLSVIYGKAAFEVAGSFECSEDYSDMFFTLDLNTSSIPYHFTGSVMPGIITLSGDYDMQMEVRFEGNKELAGSVQFNNLPVKFQNNTTIFSSNTYFSYDTLNGPQIVLQQFEAEVSSADYMTNPKLVLTGNITKYGAQLDSIAYSDLYSSLQGDADVTLNINNSIFDSIGLRVNVKNPLSQESIVFDGVISNPEQVKLDINNFKENIYLNLQLELNSFGLNRFGFLQNENNKITASLFASGVLENPYVSVNLQDSSLLISTSFLKLSGSAVLEDKIISVNDLDISYDMINVSDIVAQFSLEDYNLSAAGELKCNFNGKTLLSPLSLDISNVILNNNSLFPDSFFVTMAASSFGGTLIKKSFPLTLNASYSDKTCYITSSENAGINGTMDFENGLIDIFVDNKDFISFGFGGISNSTNTSLSLYELKIDLIKLLKYLNFDDMLLVEKGMLEGNIMINSSLDTPDFSGTLEIPSPVFKLPSITKQRLTSNDIIFTFNKNEIRFENTTIKTKNNQKVDVQFDFILNKWILDRIEGSVITHKQDLFPVKILTPFFDLEGDVSTDLKLAMEGENFDISGKILGENVILTSSVTSFSSLNQTQADDDDSSNQIKMTTDLDIKLGTHASISFDPILRCVFVPNTSFTLKMNQDLEQYSVTGELKVRSGDVSYLNRNFYIKSGAIKFNPNEILNPIVTLHAETREKDYKGQNVKIIMTVENQYLNNMEPRFTSDPIKSENEIRVLLGQIVVADSSNASDLLFAASDYALQSTVMRSMENKLRDLLNFDIFSIRTNVLQNTLSMGMSGDLSKNNISIGNFLDNSTVYVGRYLGSSLYVDAMLHVSFENAQTNDIISVGRPIFQPEFGLEFESPFSNIPVNINPDFGFLFTGPNIRINMAPDINAMLKGEFIPSTSLTLSWKLTF